MIPVNFCNSQHTQQKLSIAEHWVNFQNLFWQLLLCNIPCIMPSFNALEELLAVKKHWNGFGRGREGVKLQRCLWMSFKKLVIISDFITARLLNKNLRLYKNKHRRRFHLVRIWYNTIWLFFEMVKELYRFCLHLWMLFLRQDLIWLFIYSNKMILLKLMH